MVPATVVVVVVVVVDTVVVVVPAAVVVAAVVVVAGAVLGSKTKLLAKQPENPALMMSVLLISIISH